MRSEFLVFGKPQINRDEIDEVARVMESGWLGTGPKVAEFEKRFANYKSVSPECVAAVNSCTAALHISMIAAGLSQGDEVITTALTFCATVNAIIHAGAKPVLADIDPVTFNICPESVAKNITNKTKAIVPVHFAGYPCDMDALISISGKYNLKIIEDCAHAIETKYKGKNAGTFGDFSCFSFYVTKNLTTGEGGMVAARSEADIARAKVLSLHGMSKDAWNRYSDSGYRHYQVIESGFKYNMMDIQAAIGVQQLQRIEENWLRRKEIWQRYSVELDGLPIVLPADVSGSSRHGYHLYPILIDTALCGIDRDQFLGLMTDLNIGVGVHYLSVAEHPFYQETFGWKVKDYPNAMKVGRATVSLPFSAQLTDGDVADVIAAVRQILPQADCSKVA